MELSKEQIKDLYERILKIKHRIGRVIGRMEKEKARAEAKEQENVQELLLSVTMALDVVEIIYNANNE